MMVYDTAGVSSGACLVCPSSRKVSSKVQFKQLCLPVKSTCLQAQNINETHVQSDRPEDEAGTGGNKINRQAIKSL